MIAEQAKIISAYECVPSDVAGWSNDFAWLYAQQVAQAKDGACFVEIGSWLGKSTVMMGKMIQESTKAIRFYAVDHFQGSGSDIEHFQAILDKHGGSVRPIFDANLTRHGVRDLVRVIEKDSRQAAAKFHDDGVDFVFLDADHDYENVVADIGAWLPKVKSGGLLAGHDWGYMGVAQAVMDTLPGPVYVVGAVWCYYKP